MIQIREAVNEDEAGVIALAREFQFPAKLDENFFHSVWNEKLADSNAYIGIAQSDGAIIGYVSGYIHLAFYANGSTFWVDEIFVEENMRRSGVGTDLMGSVMPWIENRDCKLIALATNGAKQFYNELGFRDSARYFKKYL